MKLKYKFKNKYHNITYNVYETENGIKVLYLDNPVTVDFDFAILFKAGTSFETKENVPNGTAHFLEHMLLNPNSTFKTKEEIDKFEQGSKTRPALDINASTTRKNIYITSHTNQKGYLRSMERVESILEFPKRKFASQMEKERGIILAEKSRKLKKEKDPFFQSLIFLFNNEQKEFTYDILGEEEDIKRISINDLEKYFKSRFVTGNCVFAIQAKGEMNSKVKSRLEQISKKIPYGIEDIPNKPMLKNRWKVGCFNDNRANGVSFSLMYFNDAEEKIDYKLDVVQFLTSKLLAWLAFDVLREKKSLIYSFSPFKAGDLSFYYDISGFSFTTEQSKVLDTLNELYTLMHDYTFHFLKTKKGREWFDDAISRFIFPRSIKFSSDLAESDASSLIEDKEIFNDNKSVKAAKAIVIEDIQEYLKEMINIPPHIWIEGNINKKEIIEIVNKSLFGKRFNIKKPLPNNLK
jgi:predicted Zn-dependent peptidase